MMARRLRLFGMVEVAGMAPDGLALALRAVRAANRVLDQSLRMLVKEVQ